MRSQMATPASPPVRKRQASASQPARSLKRMMTLESFLVRTSSSLGTGRAWRKQEGFKGGVRLPVDHAQRLARLGQDRAKLVGLTVDVFAEDADTIPVSPIQTLSLNARTRRRASLLQASASALSTWSLLARRKTIGDDHCSRMTILSDVFGKSASGPRWKCVLRPQQWSRSGCDRSMAST